MPSALVKGKRPALELSRDAFDNLGLEDGCEYELLKARDGVWVMLPVGADALQKAVAAAARAVKGAPASAQAQGTATPKQTPAAPVERKVLSKLSARTLSDRAEGRFERFLTSAELTAFKKMLKEGRVELVKAGKDADKGTYKEAGSNAQPFTPAPAAPSSAPQAVAVQTQTPSQPKSARSGGTFTLAKDGFQVTASDNEARALSEQLREDIERKKVLGVKSFYGNYYILRRDMYNKHRPALVSYIQKHAPASIEDIAQATGIEKALAQGICEILREEGELLEKRREVYAYVG